MTTNFEQQQPLNVLGFCKSAPMEQHGGPHLPLIAREAGEGPAPAAAPPAPRSQRAGRASNGSSPAFPNPGRFEA